ncbi:hypothetical protein [Nocardia thailandica]|uniref:hypothetical protein n=1 Tax=Nocardia thailandica TaxID=257275 RepID=UPI0012FAB27F|nr:hypothetical protein [Nocardia thailandica]
MFIAAVGVIVERGQDTSQNNRDVCVGGGVDGESLDVADTIMRSIAEEGGVVVSD